MTAISKIIDGKGDYNVVIEALPIRLLHTRAAGEFHLMPDFTVERWRLHLAFHSHEITPTSKLTRDNRLSLPHQLVRPSHRQLPRTPTSQLQIDILQTIAPP